MVQDVPSHLQVTALLGKGSDVQDAALNAKRFMGRSFRKSFSTGKGFETVLDIDAKMNKERRMNILMQDELQSLRQRIWPSWKNREKGVCLNRKEWHESRERFRNLVEANERLRYGR